MKLMKRWILRTAIGLLVLAVVTAVAIQVVLLTDLPRQWILETVAKQTGLHVEAESLSVGWTGRTTIRHLALKMPLNERPFLAADSIELSHRSLPMLLLTRSLGVRSVRVMHPHAYLWRDEQGRWNVQNVAEHLAALGDSSQPRGGDVTLPNVDMQNGLIEIADSNGTPQTVGPVEFQGIAERASVWRFALQTPEGVAVHGQLAEGGNWTHGIEFDMEPSVALRRAVLPRPSGKVRAAGRWDGRVEKKGLRGTVRFDALDAGRMALTGVVHVAAEGAGVTLSPNGLVLSEPNLFGQTVRIAAGTIRIDSDGLGAKALLVRTETTAAQVSGRWDFDAQAGEGSATWAGRLSGQGGEHKGTVHATVKSPRHGLKEAQFETSVEAQTPVGFWRVAVQTQGAGRRWDQSRWRTSLGEFTWKQGEKKIDLSGAVAEVAVAGTQVRLADLFLPNGAQVNADAQLDWGTQQWAVRLDATGVQLSESSGAGLDVRLEGKGDSRKAVVSELRVARGQTVLAGKGELSLLSSRLHDAHLSAQWPDRSAAPNPTLVGQTSSRGQWRCEIDVTGKVRPVALDTSGTLTGQNVRLGKRNVTQLEIPVQARVDTERVEIATSPFALLGGRWQLSGKHELADPQTELHLTIDNLSLQTAAQMAGSPITCQGQATARLQLFVPHFQMGEALAFGEWDVVDLSVPPFEAQTGHGQIRISDGLVRFDEIQLVQGQGRARGAMRFRLDQPQRLSIQFNSTDWPLRWDAQPVILAADSDVDLQLDLLKTSLEGQGQLSSRLIWQDRELGRMTTSVRVHERVLEVDRLRGDLLGGWAEGSGRIRLDRPTDSTGQLRWGDIQPDQLASWWPQAARAGGRFSGALTARQVEGQSRPLEPLRLEFQAEMADGHVGAAQVRDCNVVAYLGRRRFLVDASTFRLLGGEIRGWARVSPHAGKLHLQVAADVNNVDLGQLTRVTDPNTKPLIGKLSGRGTLLTSSDWRHLNGQADLSVTESDLVNNAIVRTLYDTLSLDVGQSKPQGTGQIDVIFEGRRVRIPSFVYFNRGVEIRGAAKMMDYTLGANSPVDGYAVGSTRVLKDVPLPGVRQLDRLMSSLQTGIASVTIKGTVGQTQVNVVPLPVVGEAFRGLLWTQLREDE